jgi:hypothetical protein
MKVVGRANRDRLLIGSWSVDQMMPIDQKRSHFHNQSTRRDDGLYKCISKREIVFDLRIIAGSM